MTKFPLALLLTACIALPGCASGGGSGTFRPADAPGGAMDDATITARVKTVLLNDTQIAATKIDVATVAGVVTISGSVKSKAEEARAIELARTVTGVRDVKSALQISPGS
ncbi:MAG: BON domain-containing protein [Acidobacteria bacterium]|nr:BON domain-containing protein [Acidobacteriota bacterium]